MAFERQENSRRVIEIIEFSCPYGYVMRERDALKQVFEQKRPKYAQLMRKLSAETQKLVRLTIIIILSLGAVYLLSLKQLNAVLKCDDRELRKLG
jgi:hypothetical protein